MLTDMFDSGGVESPQRPQPHTPGAFHRLTREARTVALKPGPPLQQTVLRTAQQQQQQQQQQKNAYLC